MARVTSARFHRLFRHLALLSALLLAVMPTAGRLLQAGADPDRLLLSLCTRGGLSLVAVAADDLLRTAGGLPDVGAHGEGDCPYCPLLGQLLPVPGLALDFTGFAPPPLRVGFAVLPPAAYPRGLGSRGPPFG